jgi:hypothetical protein
MGCWDSAGGVPSMMLRAGHSVFRKPAGLGAFAFSKASRRALGPTHPLLNEYRGSLLGMNGRSMMLTTHLHCEFKNKQSYYASALPNALMARTGTTLPPFSLQKLSIDMHNSRCAV